MAIIRIGTLIVVGFALFAACVAVVLEVPSQLVDYAREPEDSWGAIVYACLLAVAAFSFLGAAAVLFRASLIWLVRPVAVSCGLLLVFGGVFLGLLLLALSHPDSTQDPVAWLIAFLLIGLPVLPLRVVLNAARDRSLD